MLTGGDLFRRSLIAIGNDEVHEPCMEQNNNKRTFFPIIDTLDHEDIPSRPPQERAFTSFNADTFRTHAASAAQQSAAEKEAKLQRAADYFIPSSSESDGEAGSSDEEAKTSANVPKAGEGSPPKPDPKRERQHKKKRKRHKDKKEKEREIAKRPKSDAEKIIELEARAAASGKAGRAARVDQWVGRDRPSTSYIQTHGDRDNLAFDGLYRANVAAYDRLDPMGIAKGTRPRYGYAYGPRGIGAEVDDEQQRSRKGQRRRYFMAKVVRRERDGRLKRWRIHHLRLPQSRVSQSKFGQLSRISLDVSAEQSSGHGQSSGVREADQAGKEEEDEAAESAEQYMMRRTRDFNVAVRERPYDLQLWLNFAAFQDEVGGGGRRASGAGIAEKKIAILEQALKHHPGSDELLLALLAAVEAVLSDDDVEDRWRSVLARHSGSARLWRAFLAWQRAKFGSFSCSAMRVSYGDALLAMVRERARRRREGAPQDVLAAVEQDIVGLLTECLGLELQNGHTEQAIACIQAALEFNFFSPHFDDALAKLRAFRAFWNSGAALIGDEGARGWHLHDVPEEVPVDSPREQAVESEEREQEQEEGGWGGWVELPTAAQSTAPAEDEEEGELAAGDGDNDDDDDAEADIPLEGEEAETEEELMARLGLKLEEELAQLDADRALDSRLARRWASRERARDRDLWRPLRGGGGSGGAAEPADPDAMDAAAGRAVEFEDLEEFVFSLESEEARRELMLSCLALLGVPWEAWHCTNAAVAAGRAGLADTLLPEMEPILPSWRPPGMQSARSHPTYISSPITGTLPGLSSASGEPYSPGDPIAAKCGWLSPVPLNHASPVEADADDAGTDDAADAGQQHEPAESGEALVRGASPTGKEPAQPQLPTPWYMASEERRHFAVRTLQLLALGPLSGDVRAADALLTAEATEAKAGSSGGGGAAHNHERALATAQGLLAKHRDNLPLWQAYAKRLVASDQIKAARKVYDTMLASLPAMPQSYVRYAPLAVHAYAAAELQRSAADSSARAMHILAWFGNGGPYLRYKAASGAADATSAADKLLQARRGYQDMLSARLGSSADALLSSGTAALVRCAALFEELLPAVGGPAVAALLGGGALGVHAAAAVYRHALEATSLEVRRQSAEHEALQVQCCFMLARQCAAANLAVSPGCVRSALFDALKVYPRNSELLGLLAIMEVRAHTVSRLRRQLRSMLEATPSPQLWLLALRCEAALPGAAHRVQGLFERALGAKQLQQCALLWRAYIGYELSRRRPEAARRVFLRAIHACPWCKALWLDGLVALGDVVSVRERGELMEVMREKDVSVRTDTYEILLEAIGERQLI